MKEKWTGEIVGRMHIHDITFEELGKEVGWAKGYVSMILNGHRKPAGAREKLEAAVIEIIKRRQPEKTDSKP